MVGWLTKKIGGINNQPLEKQTIFGASLWLDGGSRSWKTWMRTRMGSFLEFEARKGRTLLPSWWLPEGYHDPLQRSGNAG